MVTEERVPSGGTSAWWVFLLMGIGWVIVSLIVLSFDPTSAAAIGWTVARRAGAAERALPRPAE